MGDGKDSNIVKTPIKDIANDSIDNVNSLSHINLLDPNSIKLAEAFLTRIARSKKGGITSLEDGLAILMRAQDLKLPFSTCIEHIHVINGKTGIDIHIMKALLSKAGLTWRKLRDYSPLYEYTDGFNVYIENQLPDYVVRTTTKKECEERQASEKNEDIVYVYPTLYFKDFNGNIYKSYQWNPNLAIAMNQKHAAELNKAGKVPVYRIPNQPIDFITEYEINRIVNGKEHTATGSFSYSEAMNAGLFEKDTYIKYSKVLISHRAFTYAAREIASDILFGTFETTELKIMTGTEINNRDIVDITVEEIKN